MPPASRAAVSYKKKDGHLTVSEDRKYLFWTPAAPPGASPAVTIPVQDITNLQQTPESSPKVALKVFVKEDSHVFSFTSKENARKEQEAVTDTLRNTIASNKAASAAAQLTPAPGSGPGTPSGAQDGGAGGGGQSAAMAIAKAVSSKAADEAWYDDNKLKTDAALQRSLLEADKVLRARFDQALRERPESVSISQFSAQFWSARLHLLRTHAIERAQRQGEYNVLPEIRFVRKPAEREGEPDIKHLQITKDQIKLIFKQYPVVSEAYNDNVPPLDTGQFWQRFFSSRLLKKLKGEKITHLDPPDGIMDRYLDRRETGPASAAYIPHFIDLEGNENNHSWLGNRPDQDMRPSSYDKVPILRVLNNLAEKMISHVAPEDGEAHAPIGLDEETFEQLRLRDLALSDQDNRVHLTVKEQQRYVGGEEDDLSADAKKYALQDPAQVLAGLKVDLKPTKLMDSKSGSVKLQETIGWISEDDSDSEDETPSQQQTNGTTSRRKAVPVGSHKAVRSATSSILSSVRKRQLATLADPDSHEGLTQSTFDQLSITQNTTVEFLRFFWSLFLLGDGNRSAELAQHVSILDRSLDRINAVSATAEAEREKEVAARKAKVQEYEKRTGKRRRVDYADIGGGKQVVEGMIRPTVGALAQATNVYRKALEEQTKEAGLPAGTVA